MTMTKLVITHGFSTLCSSLDNTSFNYAGKKTADLEALNESLRDLLDGIQVSWIENCSYYFFVLLQTLYLIEQISPPSSF